MTPKRIYYVMNGVIILLVITLLASVYFGSSLIKKQSGKLTAAKTQSKVIEEQQVLLTQAKKDIEKYSDLDNVAKSIVPQDKDQAKTIREINKIATENGIALKGIAFQTSNLGTLQAKPATGASEGEAAPSAAAASPLTQVKPVEGINGVYSLEIVVTSRPDIPVPYSNFISFLQKLESNRRTAHVTKISVLPDKDTDGKSVSFILTLNAYVKP